MKPEMRFHRTSEQSGCVAGAFQASGGHWTAVHAHSSPGSQQMSSCHPHIAQRKQRHQLRRVLGQTFIPRSFWPLDGPLVAGIGKHHRFPSRNNQVHLIEKDTLARSLGDQFKSGGGNADLFHLCSMTYKLSRYQDFAEVS